MTRNQIIAQLFTGKNFNECISKMDPDYLREDLKMEVALIVCEWPEEKVCGLHQEGKLEFYVVRVILNMLSNKYSPFFKRYRSAILEYKDSLAHNFREDREQEDGVSLGPPRILRAVQWEDVEHKDREKKEHAEDEALRHIDTLHWYNAGLLKLYFKEGSYRALEEKTGIPYVSCYHTIQKSIKELKQKVLCSTGI